MTEEVDLSVLDSILAEVSEKALSEVDPDRLKWVSHLCEKMVDLEKLKARVETKLSDLKASIHRLSTEEIPSAMDEAGVNELSLKSGHRVKIKPFYNARFPKEADDPIRFEQAVSYIEENGYDGYLKSQIIAEFGRGDNERMAEAMALLSEHDVGFTRQSTIHWASMEKIYSTEAEAGGPFPVELFNAYHGRKTTIKEEK